MPLLYEDQEEEEKDMGDTYPHTDSLELLLYGLRAHLAGHPHYRVLCNMNLYYSTEDLRAYISPDEMVVAPFDPRVENLTSYRIGVTGPAPLQAVEVLSPRSAQQQDLGDKLIVYAMLGVVEYVLVDTTGHFLPGLLLLKRLQADRTWVDQRDPDGGITSQLGYRVIIETDGRVRVLDAATGRRYPRPDEANTEAEARQRAEERVRQLQAELARMRQRPDRPAS
jgi:hypothetical protein